MKQKLALNSSSSGLHLQSGGIAHLHHHIRAPAALKQWFILCGPGCWHCETAPSGVRYLLTKVVTFRGSSCINMYSLCILNFQLMFYGATENAQICVCLPF